MKEITIFPIRKTETGLTATCRTLDSLEERLLFVDDAYTAKHLGVALPKGTKTWVECQESGDDYPTFKRDQSFQVKAPAGHHFDVVPWPDRENGGHWKTRDGNDTFHGLVLKRD